MSLPINGRIAIIDDQFDQALPIINVLSKNKQACTYYSGEVKYLPNQNETPNDIRLLFLDINLIDNSEHPYKEIKSRLVTVLKRVIPENNHPYVLVYWSRHERDKNIIEEIFEDDLPTRKPISYTSVIKSDFFDFEGNFIAEEDDIQRLIQLPNELLKDHLSYKYLLEWENIIHRSSNITIKEIFDNAPDQRDNWTNNANFILNKVSYAYLGEHFNACQPIERVQGSFMGFMSVFSDTCEQIIYSCEINDPQDLKIDEGVELNVNIPIINEKLNLSKSKNSLQNTPGNVFVLNEPSGFLPDFFQRILSFFQIKSYIKDNSKELIEEVLLKKQTSKKFKEIKEELKIAAVKIGVITTPVCDFSQKKQVADKYVKGIIIPDSYFEFIDKNSEALYIIPFSFTYNGVKSIMILDFRYLNSANLVEQNISIVFRVRNEMLSEIQSRLARHINRQGILSLSEN